ncbi:MAG: penicillin-binding protein 1C [Polyangiaceae bacterium]|nr:penicillin-binding protein 1C [Polyangiaceae bacterium]
MLLSAIAPALPSPRRLVWGTLRIGLLVALGAGVWGVYRARVGDPAPGLAAGWHEGRRVLDRRGRELRDIPSEAGNRGRSLGLEEMGDRIVLATLAAEDKRFFEHEGVDGAAIVRAIGQNIRHGRLVSGASTITQQLVKLIDSEGAPGPRTVGVKVREAARAENLEARVGKREILEAYLNRLPYGHGLAGPEAAARGYFGVAARDLSWAQAAFLAVLPRAPSMLDPYEHGDRARARQRALLDELREEGVLAEADYSRAIDEEISPRRIERMFRAPHFVDALIQEGGAAGGATATSLDAELQEDVEGLARTHLAALAGLEATSAAVMVVDNATGEVLAHLGSVDYWDAGIDGQVDMVRARRQPGSALKPFVYAMAFARGHSAAEMLADVPTSFAEDGGVYAPGNFDGTFEGPISAREALAGSLNVPAVRLAAEVTPERLLEALHSLGFASLDREAGHYGLALSLGSGEVTLRELAGAYVALARGGTRIPLRTAPVAGGEAAPEGARVIDAAVAALLSDALSDPLARVRGLHGKGPFDIGFPVAVKTGTSSGFRDTWAIGFTRERTVAVWVGNPGGQPTVGLTGASGAGPLFADVMRRAMADVPGRAPLWDEGLLDEVEVCPLSGKIAGPACPERATRRFVHGHAPGQEGAGACDVHALASAREAGPGEAPFRCDPGGTRRIVVLPEAFDGWLARLPPGAPGQDAFGMPWYPRDAVEGCRRAGERARAPELRIESPAAGSVFARSQRSDADAQGIEIAASFSGDAATARRVAAVELVVDGVVAARSRAPFRVTIPATPGDHDVVVRPVDPAVAVRLGATRFSVR